MKKGNVIDEAVANCRFGQLPRPAQAEPATGMVSADYMADFKANASRNSTRSSRPYSLATASIREADGRNRYRAQWRVYGNTIDGDSVCEKLRYSFIRTARVSQGGSGQFQRRVP